MRVSIVGARTNRRINMEMKNTGTKTNGTRTNGTRTNGTRTTRKEWSVPGVIGTIIILVIYVALEVFGGGRNDAAGDGAMDRVPVELVRVVDGDTLIVNYDNEKTRVRLIGINSPESVHEDTSKNTQEGRDASEFLKKYLEDVDMVWLEFDTEMLDQYERTLAYVWMNADGTDVGEDMLNGIIVKKGYAEARSYKPNVKYQDALESVERAR